MKSSAGVVLVSAVLVTLPALSPAAVLTVDCGGGAGFSSIQEAVDAAASGDTILVAPCVYNERVDIVDKVLYLRGAGSDITEIRWAGEYEPLSIESSPAAQEFLGEVSGFTIVREAARMPALYWKGGTLHIYDCVVVGDAIGATGYTLPPAAATIIDSELESLHIGGSGRYTHITDSVIGNASLYGYCLYSGAYHPHWLWSEGCEYGTLNIGLTNAELESDVVGALDMGGTANCTATDTWFGEIDSDCSSLRLTECEVAGGVSVWGSVNLNQYTCGVFRAAGCLFRDNVEIEVDLYDYVTGYGELRVLHNTFLGNLICIYNGDGQGFNAQTYVRGNVVLGYAIVTGDAIFEELPAAVTHNDFAGSTVMPVMVDSVFANISEDPLFCDEGAEDFTLQECSPCVGTAHDGGDMGAFGVGCECSTMVEETTWGRIKSLYR